jgi:hypothetical protein
MSPIDTKKEFIMAVKMYKNKVSKSAWIIDIQATLERWLDL